MTSDITPSKNGSDWKRACMLHIAPQVAHKMVAARKVFNSSSGPPITSIRHSALTLTPQSTRRNCSASVDQPSAHASTSSTLQDSQGQPTWSSPLLRLSRKNRAALSAAHAHVPLRMTVCERLGRLLSFPVVLCFCKAKTSESIVPEIFGLQL